MILNQYLGYSSIPEIRFKSSSGGVGTSIIKFLFELNKIDLCVTFVLNERLQYEPKLIHSYEEYNNCGSVYQEMNYLAYLKKEVFTNENKGKRLALFCLPCHSKTIRALSDKSQIKVVIIGLVCSSQQNYTATQYLLKRLKVKEEDVKSIRYRGNGWPSGVQILKNNGNVIFVPNNNSLWTKIFHSRLFSPKRCFWCNDTLNKNADIVLADPWIRDIMNEEKIGKTLLATYSEVGNTIISECIEDGCIIVENPKTNLLLESQRSTIIRKNKYRSNPNKRSYVMKFVCSKYYLEFVTSSSFFFAIHCWIRNKVEKYIFN